jgi:hypothetical protein
MKKFQTGISMSGFILDPQGNVILKHYKVAPLYPVEHSGLPTRYL